MEEIQFKIADLHNHINTCVKFREDSFMSSLDSKQSLFEEMGENGEKYLKWLLPFAKQNPEGVIHIWKHDKIIGQLEFMIRPPNFNQGYINLFYLIPDVRGTGVSALMHNYVTNALIQKGCTSARLSVSETNLRALSFYKKNGWQYLRPREENNSVHLYQLLL